MPTIPTKPDVYPITNAHTHLFTGDHVPPWLARTFVPWPFYLLFPTSGVVGLFRFWYRGPYRWRYKPWYRQLTKRYYQTLMALQRSRMLRVLYTVVGLGLAVQVFFIVAGWAGMLALANADPRTTVAHVYRWLSAHHLLWQPASFAVQCLVVLLLAVLFPSGRNLVWWLLTKTSALLGALPGPATVALAQRYLTIGRFAFYRSQAGILGRLRQQYPPQTRFIVLPMDMEYMGAGELRPGFRYREQMQELAAIKARPTCTACVYPFVFADPRRLRAEGEAHFRYSAAGGRVVLEDCFIRRYIEGHRFSGFKIYPALGYYPFDETLLPLWKYAADHGLPVLTHCIRGTIFFRGSKEQAWDYHPVFEQARGAGAYEPLALLERHNREFSNNFTHPLNYLCLLDERLLRRVVGQAQDARVRALFGYTSPHVPLQHNLAHLKLCFGHFGGDDEWDRFLELDRDNYASRLVRFPARGIRFLTDAADGVGRGQLEQIWRGVDWYTIICSLMLQYEHVYADLSYILHNDRIKPLLKQTLANPELGAKVLFGTDFYVVRNHKSEKHLLADMRHGLTEAEFDAIARVNPARFLLNQLPA